MIVRVAQQALKSGADRVVVATDSVEVIEKCMQFNIDALLTRADHASGSDRLAEACMLLQLPDDALVVNVQGDEPLIDPQLITDMAALLIARPDCAMSTAAHAIDTLVDFENPNVVKVVLDHRNTALYFSRAAIPVTRDSTGQPWWTVGSSQPKPLRHIGIYGYRAGFLRRFPSLAPAPMEQLESLEQLRVLWHGFQIAVHLSDTSPAPGVDTALDLERVRQLFG